MSEQSLPRVIAVVPTYNRKELVARCLDGILSQTTPVAQTFVIDNASTDGTADLLREGGYLDDSRVKYVRLETNTGSAGGFHTGFERAMAHTPNWIWAIDNDALPDPRCLEMLLAEADRLREHRIGTLMSYQQQSTIRYGLPRSVWEALRYGYGCPRSDVHLGDAAVPVDWFTPVSALISAAAVQQVGLPREDLFYYAEDLEYSLRLRGAGFEAFLVPQSLVDHRREASGGKAVPGWRRYYLYRNTIFVLRTEARQLGFPVQVAAVIRMTLGGLVRVLRLAIRGDWPGARLVGRGMLDGYLGRLGQRVKPSPSR